MKVKKFLIVGVLGLAAVVYGAVTNTNLRGDAASGTSTLTVYADSADVATDSAATDTFYSDTLDVLGATTLDVGINIGTWAKCKICDDSTQIIVTPYLRGVNANSSRALAAQTFGDGIAAYTSGDDSTRYVSYTATLDTLNAAKLWFKTTFKTIAKRTAAEWHIAKYHNASLDSTVGYLRSMSFDVIVTK